MQIYNRIERTKTKIKFESKSQPDKVLRMASPIERTKTKIKFESKSQLFFDMLLYRQYCKNVVKDKI